MILIRLKQTATRTNKRNGTLMTYLVLEMWRNKQKRAHGSTDYLELVLTAGLAELSEN